MKKYYLLLLLFCFSNESNADEGMWLPFLLEQATIQSMQAAGCRMSAEDIYSVNKTSRKDAVLLFNGGCTGELISGEGLLLTNHHCGFGYVQEHSSIEHDYVKNGFWAMNNKEELVCAGLTVTFIVRMEDVTEKILNLVANITDEKQKNKITDSIIQVINKQASAGTKYNASVRPIYYGNQYILIVTKTFRDVRLVGAPSQTIGNFGGDDENWMWPRHTGDISLFRIYADKNNAPADYSTDNIPYKPDYFFPVSLKGVKEGDFAMLYGFPGRTTQYISSYAVDFIETISDPNRVKIRTVKLNLWMNEMKKNDTINIQYSAKYSGIANGWKKWQGEILGLRKYNVVEMKRKKEDSIIQFIQSDKNFTKYENILPQLKLAYDTLSLLHGSVDFFNEALFGSEIIVYAQKWIGVLEAATGEQKPEDLENQKAELLIYANEFFKNYNKELDKSVTIALFNFFIENIRPENYPPQLAGDLQKFKGDVNAYVHYLFSKSILLNREKSMNAINNIIASTKNKIATDPVLLLARSIKDTYHNKFQPALLRLNARINNLNKQYMQTQLSIYGTTKKFYPDANSTLRVAFGNVKGYYPADAVKYNHLTNANGIVEKNNPNTLLYSAPQKLLSLINNKDFGQYANADGQLSTCFITNCHSTGGNSGSPVLDADGNLIGTNFDRVWEGTMSDVYYDPEICRNVSVDIRYTLFLIDKFAGAGYLLNEMKIIR